MNFRCPTERVKTGIGLLLVAILFGTAFVYSGVPNPGADSPHSTLL